MPRIHFIHAPRVNTASARSLRAFIASCAFHGAAIGLLLGLTFLYRSHLPPPKNGSAPGAPSITLETMHIVSPPPEPAPAANSILAVNPPALAAIPTPESPEPESRLTLPKLPQEGLPVLAFPPSNPAPAKMHAAIHPGIAHTATTTTQSNSHPAAAASSSSYAPGLNVLPHPPYPTEARNQHQTGTVIMNVRFDARGNVAQAEVAQSSGVPVLDATTRSFIRTHWHSAAYAGQIISQPVQYSLENL